MFPWIYDKNVNIVIEIQEGYKYARVIFILPTTRFYFHNQIDGTNQTYNLLLPRDVIGCFVYGKSALLERKRQPVAAIISSNKVNNC